MTISKFAGQYDWLSNFYPCNITYEGISYSSSEHAYQAAKTVDVSERQKIAGLNSPGAAKKAGRKVSMRPDWDKIKFQVMEDILRLKFNGTNQLSILLKSTKNEELVEGNHWHDYVWGVCNGKGQNNLGKILMKIRGDLG